MNLNNLGDLYRAQVRYGEAEPLFQRALAIVEKVLGPEHTYTITIRRTYASLLRELGREKGAILITGGNLDC